MIHKLIAVAAWTLLAYIAYATISPIQARSASPDFERLAPVVPSMEDGFKQFTTSISYTGPETVQSLTFDIDVSVLSCLIAPTLGSAPAAEEQRSF